MNQKERKKLLKIKDAVSKMVSGAPSNPMFIEAVCSHSHGVNQAGKYILMAIDDLFYGEPDIDLDEDLASFEKEWLRCRGNPQ